MKKVANKALQRYLDLTAQYHKDMAELAEDPELQELPVPVRMSIGLVPVTQQMSMKLFLDLVESSGVEVAHEQIT